MWELPQAKIVMSRPAAITAQAAAVILHAASILKNANANESNITITVLLTYCSPYYNLSLCLCAGYT